MKKVCASQRPKEPDEGSSIACFEISSATKEVVTLRRGILKTFDMQLNILIETPAEANSNAPTQTLKMDKYEKSRQYCNSDIAFTTSLQLVGESAKVRLIQLTTQ